MAAALLTNSVRPRRTVMRAVLILVMIVALCAVPVFVAILWMQIPVERLALVSTGVAATAMALLSLGVALRPSWAGGRWALRQRKVVCPPNRLISLAAGLWFGAGGVAFLGYGWLTEHIIPVILGGFAAGFVLFMLGRRYARRQGEAARAIHLALLEYSDRHDGWFPRGKGSPEASLSLLYQENPKVVTANVLRGRTTPEAAVRERLEAGELLTPETCGWQYAEGLRRFDDSELALFWDKAGLGLVDALISLGGHIVYFIDGSIEYVAADRWNEFLAEQVRRRAAVSASPSETLRDRPEPQTPAANANRSSQINPGSLGPL
jgi:hypothetical protein